MVFLSPLLSSPLFFFFLSRRRPSLLVAGGEALSSLHLLLPSLPPLPNIKSSPGLLLQFSNRGLKLVAPANCGSSSIRRRSAAAENPLHLLLPSLPPLPNIKSALDLLLLSGYLFQMAGFALFRKYKSQFQKMLNVISDNFIKALKAREDPELKKVIAEIQYYIEDKKFLQEPEGWRLQGSLVSSIMVPESDSRESYHYGSNRYFTNY